MRYAVIVVGPLHLLCSRHGPDHLNCYNSGTEGAIVVEKIGENSNPNFGFNAQTDMYEDLVVSGVIDPTKVTRTALQNAASIASLMLTTEAMVAEIPEKKPAPAGPGGHGGPDMDY
jgi:chaperonin GroEL